MSVLIGALLAILVIGVVLYPFLRVRLGLGRAPGSGDRPGSDGGGARGTFRPEDVYEAIRTLQLEYELGGVEEAEYQERLRAYRIEAATALKDQDQAEREADQLLEQQVRALRGSVDGHQTSVWEDGVEGARRAGPARDIPAGPRVDGDVG